MDSQVKRIGTKDYELSAVQDNLASALQQVLDHLNQNTGGTVPSQITLSPLLDQPRGPGTAKVLKAPALLVHGDASASAGNSVVFGDVATATAAQVSCNVGIYGNLNVTGATYLRGNVNVFPSTANGFIITPPVAGPAFYVTNTAGSVATFIVTDTGAVTAIDSITSAKTVTGANVVSNSGFKSYVDLGTQWRQSTQGGIVRSYRPVVNTTNSGMAYVVANAYMPFSGSIVGISALMTNTITADVTLQVFKNNIGGVTGQIIDTSGIKANNNIPPGPITFAKGAFPFNAGDYLGMGCYVGTGYSFSIQLGLIVEFGA